MDSKTYLAALLNTIRYLQAARGLDSADVAHLGNVLRKEGKDWTAHGFERLSAALAQLQQDNLVEVFRSEKGALRVRAGSPASAPSAPALGTATPPSDSVATRPFVPLRPPVWFAFAAALSEGQVRWLNRRTGMIWRDVGTPPGPEGDWVEVSPIPEDEQQHWADEFVKRSELVEHKEELSKAIQGPDWFRRFPSELEKHGPLLVRAWSHLRSSRIIDHVKNWALQNNVDEALLFASDRGTARWPPVAPQLPRPVQPHSLRQALLDAVGRMQTEDLLALPIPARLVIEVVRPDLLR